MAVWHKFLCVVNRDKPRLLASIPRVSMTFLGELSLSKCRSDLLRCDVPSVKSKVDANRKSKPDNCRTESLVLLQILFAMGFSDLLPDSSFRVWFVKVVLRL